MIDEFGKQRLGRESVAHSSARAERAKNRVIPPTRTRTRSKLKEVSSTHYNIFEFRPLFCCPRLKMRGLKHE
jgi:hypothetical protein